MFAPLPECRSEGSTAPDLILPPHIAAVQLVAAAVAAVVAAMLATMAACCAAIIACTERSVEL